MIRSRFTSYNYALILIFVPVALTPYLNHRKIANKIKEEKDMFLLLICQQVELTSADPELNEAVKQYKKLSFAARWFGPRLVVNKVMPILLAKKFLTDPKKLNKKRNANSDLYPIVVLECLEPLKEFGPEKTHLQNFAKSKRPR